MPAQPDPRAFTASLFVRGDTGVLQGASQAAATTSLTAMAERQQALARVILQDPAVASLSSFIGSTASTPRPGAARGPSAVGSPHGGAEGRDVSRS